MSIARKDGLEPSGNPVSLRVRIISELRHAIEMGALQPGERLVGSDLCAQLGISRTTLREALRELHTDGILTTAGGRGLAIVRHSDREMENIYDIRGALEALVIEQFIETAGEDERLALQQQGLVLKQAYEDRDVRTILVAKRDFYDLICGGARNSVILPVLAGLVLRTSSLRARSLARPERQQQSIGEIEAILRAIRDNDVEAGKDAARRHVANAAKSAFAEIAPRAGTAAIH